MSNSSGMHCGGKEDAAVAKEEDFDTALDTLEQVLDMKKERLESVEKIHALWKEMDGLLKE